MRNLKLLYDYAMTFVGVPYRWGGSNPISGVDCSGLVQELLACIGMDPVGDQTAQGLYNHFLQSGKLNHGGLGALVFYGSSTGAITHITLMLDDKSCIGANGGGSKTTSKEAADQANAFVKVRPYDYRKDVVAVIMPDYSQ